jgi:putative spermidine/putrescine transport system ATP-binding protein
MKTMRDRASAASGSIRRAAGRARLRRARSRARREVVLCITTIYVTHDQAEATELGDRIVVMRKGAIAQIGTPRDVYFTPQNRFVAEFVGAANIVEATIADGALQLTGGPLPLAGAAPADAAIAMIRPETIRIVATVEATITGRIESISFVGDRQRVVVTGATEKALVIDTPNTLAFRVGEQIGLSIPPVAIRLLPKD